MSASLGKMVLSKGPKYTTKLVAKLFEDNIFNVLWWKSGRHDFDPIEKVWAVVTRCNSVASVIRKQ